MTELTSEMLKDNAPWLACDGEAIVELETYAAAWEAKLARLQELVEKQRGVLKKAIEWFQEPAPPWPDQEAALSAWNMSKALQDALEQSAKEEQP